MNGKDPMNIWRTFFEDPALPLHIPPLNRKPSSQNLQAQLHQIPMETRRSKRGRKTAARRRNSEPASGVDYISNLPDPLAHHIISFLPQETVSQLPILSKRWETLWATYHIFEFDELTYQAKGIPRCRKLFVDSLEKSLSRRDASHVHKLRIRTLFVRDEALDALVRTYINLALNGGVQDFELNFTSPVHYPPDHCQQCFPLPERFFSHRSRTLMSLKLEGCWINDYGLAPRFPSLKEIFVRNIHTSDVVFEMMIGGCPVLEELHLSRCHGLKTLRVFSQRLRRLAVEACWELTELVFDVPGLVLFKYDGIYNRSGDREGNADAVEFNTSNTSSFYSLRSLYISNACMKETNFSRMISACPNVDLVNLRNSSFKRFPRACCLKLSTLIIDNCDFHGYFDAPNLRIFEYKDKLKLCRVHSTGGTVCDNLVALALAGYGGDRNDKYLFLMISKCPLLKILNLIACAGFERVSIASKTLISLTFDKCPNLKYIDLETPNLLYFKYAGPIIDIDRVITSPKMCVDLELHQYDPAHIHDPVYTRNFKNLLGKFDHTEKLRLVGKCVKCLTIPLNMKPPFVRLKYLKVETSLQGRNGLIDVVLAVLRLAAPCIEIMLVDVDSLSLKFKFQRNMEFNRTIYDHPRDRERYRLSEVVMSNFDGNDQEIQLLNLFLDRPLNVKSLCIAEKKRPYAHNVYHAKMMSRVTYLKAGSNLEVVFLGHNPPMLFN